ncbi:MAG TPA: hypothetical protein VGP31_05465 [Planosporangium sp.]|jgi:hypothetical protein|nr:hypothetical protein [Planosporangium sp.]
MTTIEINTDDRASTVSADNMILVAVCLFALLGLAGIITMTV